MSKWSIMLGLSLHDERNFERNHILKKEAVFLKTSPIDRYSTPLMHHSLSSPQRILPPYHPIRHF